MISSRASSESWKFLSGRVRMMENKALACLQAGMPGLAPAEASTDNQTCRRFAQGTKCQDYKVPHAVIKRVGRRAEMVL